MLILVSSYLSFVMTSSGPCSLAGFHRQWLHGCISAVHRTRSQISPECLLVLPKTAFGCFPKATLCDRLLVVLAVAPIRGAAWVPSVSQSRDSECEQSSRVASSPVLHGWLDQLADEITAMADCIGEQRHISDTSLVNKWTED